MATEVKLPELGDGIESGDVLEVLVNEGDTITKGQDIVEMETDKATVPVPSSAGGKVVKIHVSSGDTLPVGGVILEVEAASEAKSEEPPAKEEPPAEEEPKSEAKSEPQRDERSEPQQKAKAAEKAAAPKAEAETKAESETQAEAETKEARRAQPAPAAERAAEPAAAPAPQPRPVAATPPSGSTASGEVIPAGPAIRRFAREVGVDLANVQGSGEGGRITRDDVLQVVRQTNQAAKVAGGGGDAAGGGASAAKPATADGGAAAPTGADDYGPVRVERMSKIRRTISTQMHASWSTVPRVTNFDDADITDLERLRQSSKEDYAAQGIKLTTMPFLIKAVATALRHHPAVNAVVDQDNEQIIYRDYVNVGIAVDTDRGLVVPVMHNTDKMGIPDVARGLARVAASVRSGQFAVSDLRGGTFTISNLGAIGGQYSTPIVNIPEVAILLVGRSRKLPVVMPDDSIQPRLMMPLSLSYDHRLVDGATAARFLNDVIGYLEAPSRLLLAL